MAPGLRLDDHADDRVVLDDRGDDHSVEQRLDPCFGDHVVGDVLEPLGVEGVAVALGFGLGCAGRLRPLLELDADALGILGLFVAIPGEALDPDLGDVAAEAAVTFEEKHRYPGAGGTDCGGEATRSGADHEDVGVCEHLQGAGGFGDHTVDGRSGHVRSSVPRSWPAFDGVSSGQLVRHTSAESAPTGIGLVV